MQPVWYKQSFPQCTLFLNLPQASLHSQSLVSLEELTCSSPHTVRQLACPPPTDFLGCDSDTLRSLCCIHILDKTHNLFFKWVGHRQGKNHHMTSNLPADILSVHSPQLAFCATTCLKFFWVGWLSCCSLQKSSLHQSHQIGDVML